MAVSNNGRRFVLLMPWGRVGSNLVAATLASSPDIRIDNEPTTRIRTFGERDGVPKEDQAQQQLAELETFLAEDPDDMRAAGLKLSYRSLIEPRVYLAHLRTAAVPLVLMTRKNHLKCAVSQLRARVRAGAESTPWQSPWAVRAQEPKPGPVEIDPVETVRLAKLFERLHAETLKAVRRVYGDDWLSVEYAELAASPKSVIGRICDWTGLDRPETEDLPHRKATSDDLSEDVLNYTELASAAEAAGFADMLSRAPG